MSESSDPERKRRERSVRYPGVPLAEAIEFCGRMEDRGLDGLSAQAIAAGLGHGSIKTNTFSARLSAARQFGLLSLKDDGYALTTLGKGLIGPLDGSAAGALRRRAMCAPPLYAELLARLAGRKVPEVAALANVLQHQFEITASAKDAAARAFHDSAKYAGMLDGEGVLREGEPAPAASPADPAVRTRPSAAVGVRIDLKLWGNDEGKVVRVRAPESMTAESFDRLIQSLRLHVRIGPGGDESR